MQAAFVLSIPRRRPLDETQETLRTSAFPSTHVRERLPFVYRSQLGFSSLFCLPALTRRALICSILCAAGEREVGEKFVYFCSRAWANGVIGDHLLRFCGLFLDETCRALLNRPFVRVTSVCEALVILMCISFEKNAPRGGRMNSAMRYGSGSVQKS